MFCSHGVRSVVESHRRVFWLSLPLSIPALGRQQSLYVADTRVTGCVIVCQPAHAISTSPLKSCSEAC